MLVVGTVACQIHVIRPLTDRKCAHIHLRMINSNRVPDCRPRAHTTVWVTDICPTSLPPLSVSAATRLGPGCCS